MGVRWISSIHVALLVGLGLAARVACADPWAPPNSERGTASQIDVEIALVGPAAQSPALQDSIRALAESEGSAPRFVHLDPLPRRALAEAASTPTPGTVRVWVDLSQPQRALLLLSGPTGQRYILRELPLSHGLDEVGREQISQVIQSSTLALLRGDPGLDRASMQRALDGPTVQRPPPVVVAPKAKAAEASPVGTEHEPPWGRLQLGVLYALAWTGDDFGERHALGLRLGVAQILDSPWSVLVTLGVGFPQYARDPLVEVKTQTTSLYGLLGHTWPLGNRFGLFAALGGGLTATRATPLAAEGSNVALRDGRSHFGSNLRAELGFEYQYSVVVLSLSPWVELDLNRTSYHLTQGNQRSLVGSPGRLIPGVQLTVGYRQDKIR